MKMSPAKLAAAALVGFIGIGSAQLANAQDDSSTTTTVEESTTDDTVTDDSATDDGTARGEDCPKDAEAPPTHRPKRPELEVRPEFPPAPGAPRPHSR